MNNFSGCLFDLDGIIVETDKYHFLAWKALADKLNIVFTENDNERLKGVSRMASMEIILSLGKTSLDEAEKIALATQKNELYCNFLKELTTDNILPGVIELIKSFKQHHIKVGIGSSSKNAKLILEQVGLIHEFDTIIDGSMVENSKPAPDIFLLGAKRLNINPKDCLVIEDAESGVKAAKRAGMKCIGVGNPSNLSEADLVINSLSNLRLEEISSLYNNQEISTA